jgi:uncharacterized protein
VSDQPESPEPLARYAAPEAGSLKARLAEETRAALKARDRVRLGALRMLSAAITNREVELGRGVSDEEFLDVATREVKRRLEAIEAFEKGGRPERAAQEREEKAALQEYIPPALSDEELDALVDEAMAKTGASGPADFGKVMGMVMGKAKGRADGKVVQQKVRARLG